MNMLDGYYENAQFRFVKRVDQSTVAGRVVMNPADTCTYVRSVGAGRHEVRVMQGTLVVNDDDIEYSPS